MEEIFKISPENDEAAFMKAVGKVINLERNTKYNAFIFLPGTRYTGVRIYFDNNAELLQEFKKYNIKRLYLDGSKHGPSGPVYRRNETVPIGKISVRKMSGRFCSGFVDESQFITQTFESQKDKFSKFIDISDSDGDEKSLSK